MATEAAQALFDIAFDHYAMHRRAKGEWIDTVIYGLLADEWDRSEPFPDTRQRA
ncbi:MAG TPA: hypothetical protein VFT75_05040 [Nocardioidaceae bacterium]|nr:hypothetical protein [Nocardioidaceae bacterium]